MTPTSFDNRIVRYEHIHCIQREHFDALIDAAAIEDGDRILDCGCGYGAVTRELLRATAERRKREEWHNVVDLVDESKRQIGRAVDELKEWIGTPTVTLRFLEGTFPTAFQWENRYDVAGVKMVLHEMPPDGVPRSGSDSRVTQGQFLKGLVRCLKPGGVLALWELSLSNTTRDFFSSVLRKKDLMAGFTTLLERRNFLSNEAIAALFATSGLVAVHQVNSFDYRFSTKRRLLPELHGNTEALEEWHAHIREEAKALKPDVLKELDYRDDGDDIAFSVKVGIFRANKPSDLRFVLEPFRGPKAGAVNVEIPAQSYLTVTRQTLIDGQLLQRLGNNHGLMRASILTRNQAGRKELCREGLDFLYNYQAEDQRWRQAEAYLAYLTALYCGVKDTRRGRNVRSMSDALSQVFGTTASAGWLIASVKGEDVLQLDIGAYNTVTGQAMVKVPGQATQFFTDMLRDIDEHRALFEFQQVSDLPLVRIATQNEWRTAETNDLDSAAEYLRNNHLASWMETIGTIRETDMHATILLPGAHLEKMLELRIVLANLFGYLKSSGTPHCYYFLPPTVRTDHTRLDEGAFVLSSPTRLSYDRFEAMLKYVSGFWSGIGSLESLRYGKQQQEQQEQLKRNRAVAGFTHQVGHVLESKSGLKPLRSFADWLVARRSLLETVVDAEEDLEFRAAQTRYASILPKVFANTMEYPEPVEQKRRIWGDARDLKEIINQVWLKLLLPCARAAGRANPTFGSSGRVPELAWRQECGVITVPNNELVEAVLFELFWNSCRHGLFTGDPVGRACIELSVRPIGGTAVQLTVTNGVSGQVQCSNDCCPHLTAFVGTLRSWKEAPRADQFAITFAVKNRRWTSALTLPVQPESSGGVYDDVSV